MIFIDTTTGYKMVAALMFGMIALIFYVIYESVYTEEMKIKKEFDESLKKKD